MIKLHDFKRQRKNQYLLYIVWKYKLIQDIAIEREVRYANSMLEFAYLTCIFYNKGTQKQRKNQKPAIVERGLHENSGQKDDWTTHQ